MDTSPSAQMIHEEYGDNLRRIAGMLRPYPFLRQSEDALLQLANNLTQPFNVAIFGRMKVGKSTLINALVRRKVAIIGVTEATATVNRLLHGTGDALQQFTVHWKSAEPETFPLERLQSDWNGTSDEVKDRITRAAWLDLYADADVLKDIRIIDTPGTDSTTAEHENIARQFIRGQEADALIYVFSTAMKEGDVRNLQDFREGCLTGSSLSNCVAVYHKWDKDLWQRDMKEIRDNARRNFNHPGMEDLVSDIIPVSAPLALLARTAPPEFWQKCRSVLSRYANEEALTERLEEDEDWEDEGDEQADLYKKAKELGAPWASFRLALRELYRHPEQDAASCIFALSGFKELEDVLDKKFFTKKSILHQQQNCARARQLMGEIYNRIEKELGEQREDIDMMDRLWHRLEGKDVDLQKWIDRKRAHLKEANDELKQHYDELDRMRIAIKKRDDCIISIPPLLDWVEETGELRLTPAQRDVIARVLRSLLPNGEPVPNVNPQDIFFLSLKVKDLQRSPSQETRQKAEKLYSSLMSWLVRNTTTSTEESTENIDS